jgi:hypothetical protein
LHHRFNRGVDNALNLLIGLTLRQARASAEQGDASPEHSQFGGVD